MEELEQLTLPTIKRLQDKASLSNDEITRILEHYVYLYGRTSLTMIDSYSVQFHIDKVANYYNGISTSIEASKKHRAWIKKNKPRKWQQLSVDQMDGLTQLEIHRLNVAYRKSFGSYENLPDSFQANRLKIQNLHRLKEGNPIALNHAAQMRKLSK